MLQISPLTDTLRELDTWVIDQSPTALCVCSAPAGEIVRYNAQAVRIWGRTPRPGEQLTGAWRTRYPDGRPKPAGESAMGFVLRSGIASRDERLLIERPDGSVVVATMWVSPLQDETGHVLGAIGAFEEVPAGDGAPDDRTEPSTDLLARHQEVRDADAALQDVLDSALIGVWDYDLVSRRAVRSLSHDQIYGYSRALDEWTFETFLDHVVPEHRSGIRARFDQCIASGAGEFDCRIIRADGSPAWIWSRGRLVRDAAGSPVRLVGIVMDVTRNRLGEQALELERRRKETFVSTMAHELRQPLSAMLAAVEVAHLAPASAAGKRAMEIMRRQIGQMDRVVEDLVDAARWAHGKVTLRQQRLDLRDVVRDAALDVRATIDESGRHLVVVTEPGPLWADADPERLQQVLSNLVRNAVKCTDAGGYISLAARGEGDRAILRVTDTGCGIEPEALPGLFDLFSQVRPSDSSGLGIGLSVVREIVLLHGGRIEARSEGPERGSEFIITLPLASPPGDVPGPAPERT